ncbi:hypothetical protein [uncultured Psychromonas sp.]|uniref:hypothetical protein n=1 Tax=uncultured Psychromonas sp. TaxID=173974 RepID=UPI002604DBA3|nr:hypothetical protein [uncultured Psychromonas sp.]
MHKIMFVLLCLLSGCAAQHNNIKLANQLQQEPPEKILSILSETEPDQSDFAQYYLNLGYLQLLSGEFELSIDSLLKAKNEMLSLQATSISENVAAGTVNETFRRYSGYPTDRVMVHNMLALGYLFNNNIDDARVEMLQADVAMKKLAENDQLNGQLASTHLLSAIIYELLDERSNAFISYQLAEKILKERNISLPKGLKLGLLRMSDKMGNDTQYQYYSQQYPALSKQKQIKQKKHQVFGLYFDGVVSNKVQQSLAVPSFNGKQIVRVSMPTYASIQRRTQHNQINDDKQQINSEVVENVDKLVREDLDKEYPSILLLTTTRAISKYQLVKEAQDKDPILGLLANLATIFSEVADLRSWNMLPATIQFSYLETDADNIVVSSNHQGDSVVELAAPNQHVILSTGLSDKVFHYEQ